MTAASIPLGDAASLRTGRVRVIRIALATALAGAAIAAFFAARNSSASPTPLLPPGSSGIIVLDLSISVENATLDRMYAALNQLAATRDRFGLVLFSSRAYEALPPNTPAAELRPFARFFHGVLPQVQTGAYQQSGEPPSQNLFGSGQRANLFVYPTNPWSSGFSFGTEISDGLALARNLIVQSGSVDHSVWLMSDLADDPGDRAAARTVARSYMQSGIALHVIGLDPKPSDKQFFAGLLGARGSIVTAEPSKRVRLIPKTSFPVDLAVVGGILALLLAVNELVTTPLDWGRES